MLVRRDKYVILLLAICFKYYFCTSIEVPFYKGDGSRPNFGSFSTDIENIFVNNTKQLIQDSSDFLVSTPGCHIPDYTKKYKYVHSFYKGIHIDDPCGLRVVSLHKIGDSKVIFNINDTNMRFYSNNKKYNCCYNYAYKTHVFPGLGSNIKLMYTKCMPFRNGTSVTLLYEIIRVMCVNKHHNEIYSDAFVNVKKSSFSIKQDKNNTSWNILMLGIRGMSRARLFGTMPETYKYLSTHKWLDYRGYTKIDSTFHNMMAILTGMNSTLIQEQCRMGLFSCAGNFIWNRFNEVGYKTAYGEDYLELPDTFARHKGFLDKPTNHYMRPFYLTGERQVSNIMCTGTRPSAAHLLDYAHDFANTYKKNLFFGIFWINTYGHGDADNPSKLDNDVVSWMQLLKSGNILKRTIVILFSDNGIKHGVMKLPVESYYDERLPMLYVWVPQSFQKKNPQIFTNMILNQHRLMSPYDIYATLGDVLKFADVSKKNNIPESCSQCAGLFKLNSLFRTCDDAGVKQSSCVCNGIFAVGNDAVETTKSINVAIKHINKIIKHVQTIKCYECIPLKLQGVIRSHAFHSGIQTNNIVVFQMSNDVIFEASVSYRRDKAKLIDLHSLTDLNNKGRCVRYKSDRAYCHCLMNCNTLII